jgi:hypothetical protein
MTLSPTMRLFLVLIALASGAAGVWRLTESFSADELYRKDFVQEYVMAKAVRAGEDPYRPMPEMVVRYVDPEKKVNWSHSSTHTPATALLSVPFAWIDYPLATCLYLGLEVCVLLAVWAAIFRWWGEPIPWLVRAVLVLMSLSFGPVIQELWFGNLSMVLLGFLVAAWLALRSGRDVVGGLWLGLAIAVKLAAWPVVIFLFLRRRWGAVAAAAAVAIGLHLAALVVLGPAHVIDYYRRVGPEIANTHRQHDTNYSLWTISARLFRPEFDSVVNIFVALSPWPSTFLDQTLRPVVPVLGLLLALVLAYRSRDFDTSFGILLCASLPVNPVAWDHGLLIAAIPIAIVLRRLGWAGWPRLESALAAVCFTLTMFPQKSYVRGVVALFGTEVDDATIVPFAAGLVTYVPLLALMGWIWLLWRLDGVTRDAPFNDGQKKNATKVLWKPDA